MNVYHTVSAFNAHNVGLLAAIRAKDRNIKQPGSLATEEERQAWQDGVSEGCAIRKNFETAAPSSAAARFASSAD
jgi:hypothetical protein